jgi:hypothetical protein
LRFAQRFVDSAMLGLQNDDPRDGPFGPNGVRCTAERSLARTEASRSFSTFRPDFPFMANLLDP